MTLREWVIRSGLTQVQVADMLGTRQQYVSWWMGGVTPKLPMMLKIQKITKGKVTVESFLPEEKYKGDVRLVKEGLAPPSLLERWRRTDGK